MTDARDHVTAELPEYVLDTLDDAGRDRVNAHVGACPACAARLAEYRAVVGSLPLALPAVPPPVDAWAAISAGIRTRSSPPRPLARRHRWARVARWSAVAVAASVLLGWSVTLQRQLARYADGPQVEKLARRPGRLVILSGTSAPAASARLFAAIDGRGGHMAVAGLAQLPAGQVYQLWFEARGVPAAAAATFAVDGDGRAWVVVTIPRPLEDTEAIVVTAEPAPGSAAPTGPPVLQARDWR